MSKLYNFIVSKLTPKGNHRTDGNKNVSKPKKSSKNEKLTNESEINFSNSDAIDISNLQSSKSSLSHSLHISDDCLKTFKQVLESSFIQRLFQVDCCYFVTDNYSVASVLVLFLRANIKYQHYRGLFLTFLYISTKTLDNHSFNSHLIGWIFDDPDRNEILKFTPTGLSYPDFLQIQRAQKLDAVYFNISSQLLNFRNQVSLKILKSIMNINEKFWAWKRCRAVYHHGILNSNMNQMNYYEQRFVKNLKGSGADRFRCVEKKCVNYFNGKLEASDDFDSYASGIKYEKSSGFRKKIGLKRTTDSEASFCVPSKRLKKTPNRELASQILKFQNSFESQDSSENQESSENTSPQNKISFKTQENPKSSKNQYNSENKDVFDFQELESTISSII